MKRWLRRIVLSIAALFLVAIVAGAVTEQVTRRRTASKFPPLGKLVDIGGRRIQIDCRGTGSPVVVFESNDLWGSLSWSAVQDKVAATTRACSYSRAGILWSDPVEGLRDDRAIARDLHAVLERAGERPPFVLVGHSLAGLYAVAYTQYFGAEVAGLVLVDPAHPDQARRYKAITKRDFSALSPAEKILSKLSWTGLIRLFVDVPKGAPKELQAMAAYAPLSLVAIVKELDTINNTFADVEASHDLGARPLYVLTAMAPASEAALQETQMSAAEDQQYRPAWKEMHDDEARWSTASQHLPVPDSGHRIQSEKPEMVIHAVKSVVEAVRSGEAPRP
jgi:pimeloyl-ACP methyl ester carboxylesterase